MFTSETLNKKVGVWYKYKQEIKSIEKRLAKAKHDLKNAELDLGKFILPEDASIGEVFSIWVNTEHITHSIDREKLLEVCKRIDSYDINFR